MTPFWQEVTAIVLALLAGMYVACRMLRLGPWKKRSTCGKCEGCCDPRGKENDLPIVKK